MEKVYQIALNEREYDALPILLHMAFVYSWELFEKKEGGRYYDIHQSIIEDIQKHQKQFGQGIMATRVDILDKLSKPTRIDLPKCERCGNEDDVEGYFECPEPIYLCKKCVK